MQKLEIVGIILVVLGIMFFILWYSGTNSYWLNLSFFYLGVFFPPIGIGIFVLPRIKKMRNSKSDLEKRKNNQSAESLKDSSDIDKPKTSNSELGRQCKVCHTNIPHGVKTCPSCGDIYS